MEKTLAESRRFPEGYAVLEFEDDDVSVTVSAVFRHAESDSAVCGSRNAPKAR